MAYDNSLVKAPKAGIVVFVAICVAFALFMEAVNLLYLYLTYSPVPFWDTWDNITPSQLFNNFFGHHNEHRIVLPRLFFIADTYLDGGRQIINIASTHLLLIVYGCLMGLIARRLFNSTALVQIGLSALFCGMFLSMQQRNILEWGFMVSWPLVYLTAIASYLVLFQNKSSVPTFAASFFLALLSSLSMANGALTLIPVIVIAAFARNWKMLGFALAGTAALLALHFWGLESSPSASQASLVEIIKYALAYIGGPSALVLDFLFRSGPDPLRMGGPGVDPTLSLWTGGGLLLLFSALSLRVLLKAKGVAQYTLVAIGGFVLITALATASGRVSFGLASAVDGRYGMGATLFTVSTGLLAIEVVLSRWSAARVPVALATIALMVVSALYQVHMAKRDRDWANLRKMPAAALLSGVDDQFVMGLVYPWKERFATLLPGVVENRLGSFSEPWADWIGKPMLLPIEADACSGELQGSDPVDGVPGALRVHGWATRPGEGLANERLIFADRNGTVVGYGFNGWITDKVKPALSYFGSSLSGWYGYVRPDAVAPVQPYLLIDSDRAACPLHT